MRNSRKIFNVAGKTTRRQLLGYLEPIVEKLKKIEKTRRKTYEKSKDEDGMSGSHLPSATTDEAFKKVLLVCARKKQVADIINFIKTH